MEWLTDPSAWVALLTLTALEIVLGVDNIIFISILVGRLPQRQRALARNLGLAAAMLTRIALLFSVTWVMSLTEPWVTVAAKDISGRDLVLLGGGLFLLWKSVHEIHSAFEGPDEPVTRAAAAATFGAVIAQIAVLDIVFSIDSVITAVGLVDEIGIMVLAIIAAVAVMLFAARAIGEFVERHPTIKMLALAFLVLVGVALVAEGWGFHIPKGYIYFSMAFAIAVELLNLRVRGRGATPVHLHRRPPGEGE
jgi:predicted tellurium resistance membrane protein TerC